MPKDKNLFYYNKNIDTQVITAVEGVLRCKVNSVLKMKHGEVNHVYKVVSDKGVYLVKVFKNRNWPEKGKLPWIEHQLSAYGIAHAKILHYSRGRKFFPNGFMITEFIKGMNGKAAVNSGKISLGRAYFEIGKILKAVHKIRVKNFGLLNNGNGNYADFLRWKLKRDVYDRFESLRPTGALSMDLLPLAETAITQSFKPFLKKLKPVLNHGDPSRENGILTPAGKWVLIDWDNSRASTWLEDYADLTFWADFRHNKDFTARRLRIFKTNFFKGYGTVVFSQAEIAKIEQGLHITQCLRLLPYYYFNKKNMNDFKETKNKLVKLLEQSAAGKV